MAKRKNALRSDGRIAVQVYLGMDPETNRRKYKTVYGSTQKEADEKARQVKLALKKGLDISTENDSFALWSNRFIEIKKSSGISISQIHSYENYCHHLKPLRLMPIGKITTGDIQDIILRLSKGDGIQKPLAKKTLYGVRGTAKQIFDLAIVSRVIDYNPAVASYVPKNAPESHYNALTDVQMQWIIDTPHRAQRAAMIMMYAGLRRGELTALTWADIDFKHNTININKSAEMVGGKPVIKSMTKTPAGMRTINIPKKLSDFLKKEKGSESPLCLYVVHTVKGQPMTNQAWRTLWSSYLKTLNAKYGGFNGKVSKFQPGGLPMKIPEFTPHWLRHTFATILYKAGVDVLTARDQLGHADIKTTLAIYTHLDKKYKKQTMSKLDDYLSREQSF